MNSIELYSNNGKTDLVATKSNNGLKPLSFIETETLQMRYQ